MKKNIIKLFIMLLFSLTFLTGIPSLQAASAKLTIKSNKSTVVVGSEFTVTVTVSSSQSLGAWEWIIKYDTSKLKLTSGEAHVAQYTEGSNIKSKSYTYKFKALASGTSTIGFSSADILAFNEEEMSVALGSLKIKAQTQAEIEASYSKNNNLSSLGVEGYKLNEEFNKDTTEYTVSVPSNVEKITLTGSVEDKTASVNGLGEFEVSEGENKFDVTVTAENGSSKTYTVKVNVEDANPIEVEIDGEKYRVVKRASALTAPSTYEPTTQMINGVEVPAFKSNITNYILVGLKKEDGTTGLYIYNEENNTYTLYKEIKTEGIVIFPKKAPVVPDYYKITKITINETEVEAYQYDGVTDYYLVYGINIENNEECFYQYDVKNNTITRYNDKIINELTKKNENFMLIIIILGIETILLIIILLIIIMKKNKSKKTKKLSFDELDNNKIDKKSKIEEKKSKEETQNKEEKTKTKDSKVK